MATPNYVLIEDYNYSASMHDPKILPAGTFVRPISEYYLPKHVLKDERWRWRDEKTEIFCYTSLGIISLPERLIRKV